MVYNIQNYCFHFNFVHRPVLEKLKNTMFRKLDLFPFSGEWGGDTYSVGSLRKS
jgi:hypothetical protein